MFGCADLWGRIPAQRFVSLDVDIQRQSGRGYNRPNSLIALDFLLAWRETTGARFPRCARIFLPTRRFVCWCARSEQMIRHTAMARSLACAERIKYLKMLKNAHR